MTVFALLWVQFGSFRFTIFLIEIIPADMAEADSVGRLFEPWVHRISDAGVRRQLHVSLGLIVGIDELGTPFAAIYAHGIRLLCPFQIEQR